MNLQPLFDLLACHSTPGEEAEVRDLLTEQWQAAGCELQRYGHYAISTCRTGRGKQRPRVLVTAHMDSPGFAVEEIDGQKLKCIRMGSPRFSGDSTAVILKTARRKSRLILHKKSESDSKPSFHTEYRGKVEAGDRLCYAAAPQMVADRYILSPFLDNRLGCALLTHLAQIPENELGVDLILAATSTEEMGGFGANVLAGSCKADLIVCLDATYTAHGQDIHVDRGPVLTLSDHAVILNGKQRRTVQRSAGAAGVTLQTEVYNYSGTDAGAFPRQGCATPVVALLVPTDGNHSPAEKAARSDLESLAKLLTCWIQTPKAVNALLRAWTE